MTTAGMIIVILYMFVTTIGSIGIWYEVLGDKGDRALWVIMQIALATAIVLLIVDNI